jgi:hypothetical protein
MKKKLNVFCVLMLLLLAAEIIIGFVLNFNEHAQAFNEGWQSGRQGGSSSKNITLTELIVVLVGLVCIYLIIRSFVSFVRFILNVNRDKVFVWKNVSLLRWTGWGLLIPFIGVVVYDVLHHVPVEQIYKEDTYCFVFSVFCLIVSEVFAIGLKLKEEQDLTI